jgi:hypothetical protein
LPRGLGHFGLKVSGNRLEIGQIGRGFTDRKIEAPGDSRRTLQSSSRIPDQDRFQAMAIEQLRDAG